ncbi:hypothetical protein N7539_008397 [Penicillium diatomitis]|uniref:Uncharacterized protein n=1 Tax=Penicillium diatomitis TaxID=2819901 RepID=A0A9X0BN50_9EURO|nr:uncharacterized protein N7539_008397 [Penicillium diatomitis]KAJ5475331.1 hypothetical protein N7539_008397 [Penicillium diatomitis]
MTLLYVFLEPARQVSQFTVTGSERSVVVRRYMAGTQPSQSIASHAGWLISEDDEQSWLFVNCRTKRVNN